MDIEKTERKGIYLWGECRKFGLNKDSDFMEITQWSNGEGYTISINNNLGSRTFELSWEELEGIRYLIDKINYE